MNVFHLFSFTFDTDGPQTFAISLKDKSAFPKNQNYKYSSARFIVVKSNNDFDLMDGVTFVGGKYDHWERDYYIECDLKAGKYFTFVEIDWHESVKENQRSFVISSYGPGESIIEEETD